MSLTGFGQIADRFRKTWGRDQVVIAGKAYDCTVTSLSAEQAPEWMPDGLRNVADADPQCFNVSPAKLVTVPNANTTVKRVSTGDIYIIAKVDQGGQPLEWRLLCYRQPVIATSTTDAAQRALWPAPPP